MNVTGNSGIRINRTVDYSGQRGLTVPCTGVTLTDTQTGEVLAKANAGEVCPYLSLYLPGPHGTGGRFQPMNWTQIPDYELERIGLQLKAINAQIYKRVNQVKKELLAAISESNGGTEK